MADIKNVNLDGTLYNYKDEKARNDISDLKEDLNGLADEGIMYANFQQILNKGFDTSNGTFPDEANWDITSFIPVTPNEIIYVYNPTATHSYNGWYQADKTYIGNFKIAKGDIVELIVPSNAHYMVLTNNHSNFVYKVWRYPKELATLTDVDDISAKTENLLEERWNSGYINADGSISLDTPSVHSLHSLNYNPCKANTAYYVYNGGTDSINIVWYDSSRAIISRELITTASGVVTSPANAAYFKVSLYNYGTTYDHNIAVFEGASPKGYIPSISASDVIAERNLDVFIERLCNNNYRKVDVSQINNVEVYSSYNSETQGSDRARIVELSGYTTYCFYAPHDTNIFVGDLSVYQYYAITKLESPKPPWVSGTGLKYMDGSSVSRIRKSENNLPSVASPLSVPKGTLLCITVNTSDVPPYLYVQMDDELILKDGIAEDIIEVEMHSNYFYYFVLAKSGNYLRYKFVHYTNNATNADGLVQRVVDLVASDKTTVIMPVVADGEWEMAVMLEDRPDFIGCMNHGSEISSIANIYFDGEKQNIVDGMKFSCRKIEATNKLTMYDPDDETTAVGYHYKKYLITSKGIEIEQRIEWVADNTAMKSYLLMMPAVRGKDTTSARQVTDTFFDDKTFTEYAVGTTTMEVYPQSQNDKGNSVNLYGKTSGVFINTVCDIENKPQSAFTYLSNSVYYNKIYVSYCGDNYPIANGDVWKWKSKYVITA